MASTVARALAVTPMPGERAADAVRRHLAEKRMLVVIDNFEHLLDATGLVGELLAGCPDLSILTTSREGLNLQAEHVLRVMPLAVPERPERATAAELEATDASALFLQAARRRDSRFVIGAGDAPVIARLCARLDGLPLALELAASRTELLAVGELEAQLDAALSNVGKAPRDAPARQRTLHATVAWSYGLLDDNLKAAFTHFAVFACGATLDAACAVTSASLGALQALGARGLLERRRQGDGSTRLEMLETVRQYALDRLVDDPAREDIRRRHLEYYLQLVEQAVRKLSTHHERDALAVLDHEIDNTGGALEWALEAAPTRALRLAGYLGDYWLVRHDPAGLHWLDAALHAAGDSAPAGDRARAQLKRGFQLELRDQPEAMIAAANAALEIYEQTSDQTGIAEAYCELAIAAWRRDDLTLTRSYAEAASRHAESTGNAALLGKALARLAPALPRPERLIVVERAARLLSQAGDYREVAMVYLNAGYLALTEDRPAEALRLLQLATPAAEQLETPASMMSVLGNMGLANLFIGDHARARKAFERQLALCVGQAFRFAGREALAAVAALLVLEGRHEQAARLLGAACAMGFPGLGEETIFERLQRDYLTPGRTQYDQAAWRHAETTGAKLCYDDAIAYALEQLAVHGATAQQTEVGA